MLFDLNPLKKIISPEDARNMYNLAVERFKLGDYQTAKHFMNLIYYIDDNMSCQYYKTYGAILQALEEYDKAIACYQAALALEYPKIKDSLFYIGVCLFKAGAYAKAKQHLEKFLAEDAANKKLLPRTKLYLKLIEKR